VLVAAFRGWNDGAQAASLAASFLAQAWEARRFADIDPEEFFDFQATRPHVALATTVWVGVVALAARLLLRSKPRLP